jgi:hypothetical protein
MNNKLFFSLGSYQQYMNVKRWDSKLLEINKILNEDQIKAFEKDS